MPSHIYHRKLPHFQPEEATFFVTFRLAGSIPMETIRQLKENYDLLQRSILEQKGLTEREKRERIYVEQKRLFVATDVFLDTNPNGPYWLREKSIAEIVSEALQHRDGKLYNLHAYTIMPNHVHMMMTLMPNAPVLFKVMQDLKKFTGLHSNRSLGREGPFWEEESYDHVVRSEKEFYRIVNYILRNPVKAGLVKEWQLWPSTFTKSELL
ncbi:MAG: REP-associated tyrosine transposase [Saprospiraceae bacterium]